MRLFSCPVPFEESPSYNTNRRLAGANLEAMRLLSKSDPRINLSSSVVNLSALTASPSRRNDPLLKSDLGHLGEFYTLSRPPVSALPVSLYTNAVLISPSLPLVPN